MTELTEAEVAENPEAEHDDNGPRSQWLSFKLAGLDYAVDILRVREIRAWEHATRIPHAPDYMVGLINLRGAIVPIVDLRRRININEKDYDKETVILIVDVETEEQQKTIGMVVDAISQVVETDNTNAQLSPNFDLSVSEEFVSGLADYGGQLVILLNIDTLLNLDF